MGQTPEDPAVMNTKSCLLRTEDAFNNKKGDSCNCDIIADNCEQPPSHQPALPTSSNGALPIWTIHPLALWTSVSQGSGTCLRRSRRPLRHLWGGTLVFRLQQVHRLLVLQLPLLRRPRLPLSS